MGDADRPRKRLVGELLLQVEKLSLGTPPLQRALVDGGDAGGIVAAVLKPSQRIHKTLRYRLLADDPNNPAHSHTPLFPTIWRTF